MSWKGGGGRGMVEGGGGWWREEDVGGLEMTKNEIEIEWICRKKNIGV